MISGLGFDNILRNEGVRCVAVVAGCPVSVAVVIPALINIIHYMTVIAGGWIVPQVGCEIGGVHANKEYRNQRQHPDCQNSPQCHAPRLTISTLEILTLESPPEATGLFRVALRQHMIIQEIFGYCRII